jgi:hypothetical protein
VILDCTGFVNKQSEAQRANVVAEAQRTALVFEGSAATALSALAQHVEKPTARIHIAWPDGGAPPLAPTFWRALIDGVQGSLCVCCIGSHGRTGTALAALFMAQHGDYQSDETLADVVAMVRKLHCDQAVETHDQVDYLEKVAAHYGVIVSGERIEPSYHYRAVPAAKPAPLGAVSPPNYSAATRAVVNGHDATTGIKVSAGSYVGNGAVLTPLSDDIDGDGYREPSKRARKRAAKGGKAKPRVRAKAEVKQGHNGWNL